MQGSSVGQSCLYLHESSYDDKCQQVVSTNANQTLPQNGPVQTNKNVALYHTQSSPNLQSPIDPSVMVSKSMIFKISDIPIFSRPKFCVFVVL